MGSERACASVAKGNIVLNNQALNAPPLSVRLLNAQSTLVLLGVALALYASVFAVMGTAFTLRHLFSLMKLASYLGIVSAGQMLTLLVGGTDMSVANLIILSGIVASSLFAIGLPLAVVILIVLAMGLAVGAVNGWFIAKVGLQPMVMTLAMGSILMGLCLVITNGATRAGNSQLLRDFCNKNLWNGLTGSVLMWLLVGIVISWTLSRRRFGWEVYLVGANEQAARLSGVPVTITKIKVYMLCSLLASLAGIMVLGYTGTTSLSQGDSYLLPGIAACLLGGISPLGGKGGYGGVAIGVFILATIDNLLTILRMSNAERQILQGAILLAFIVLYNGGIRFGKLLPRAKDFTIMKSKI